jgi:polyhydroxybutyrate depolymerase
MGTLFGWFGGEDRVVLAVMGALGFGAMLGCASGSEPVEDESSASSTALGLAHEPHSSDPALECSENAAQPLDATWTVEVGGTTRVFNVHVPDSYSPHSPTAVVLNFHGFGSDGTQQDELSGMSREADIAGFIAVHPEGLGDLQSWNAGECCGYAAMHQVDDLGFVNAMLDALESKLCVDPGRVYVTGMSNGAFFAQRIGCELSDRVAAIAPVAGVVLQPACTPSRPISVIEFHGTLDPLVPYQGDTLLGLRSVPETFALWSGIDDCHGEIAVTYENHDSRCVTEQACGAGTKVTLCTVTGGGHTWPGGLPLPPQFGYTTPYLSATHAMWTFFGDQPRLEARR